MENIADCSFKTSLQEQNYNFKWTVENVSKLPRSEWIYSCDFSVDKNDANWYASFCYFFDSSVELGLIRRPSSVALQVVGDVTVLDCNGKVYYKNTTRVYEDGEIELSFSKIESSALDELKLAPNNTWYFTFDIKTYKTIGKSSSESPSQLTLEETRKNSFCANFWKMYENKTGTDVTLQVQDDNLEVHKFVLTTQSPVFAKMFETPMSESEKNTIVIDDVSVTAMTTLVKFLYSKVDIGYSFETALELYYAADKYEVFELREICGKLLISRLTEDNAVVLLEKADQHKDANLKAEVMAFIKCNLLSCVKKDWWYELIGKKNELVKELMDFIK